MQNMETQITTQVSTEVQSHINPLNTILKLLQSTLSPPELLSGHVTGMAVTFCVQSALVTSALVIGAFPRYRRRSVT